MNIKIIENLPSHSEYDYIQAINYAKKDLIKLNGRYYQPLYIADRRYSFRERVWLGIRILAAVLFSLGRNANSEKVRSDWQTFRTGKRVDLICGKSLSKEHVNKLAVKVKNRLVSTDTH